jgi:phage host-nuclease inhibitor protein Gam
MENAVNDFEIVEEPVREAFVIDDDFKADWAMRKLASIRRKQDDNKAIFEAEVNRVQEWLETVNKGLESDAVWFESNLHPYALQQRSEGRKSVVLPHGTIKTTGGRPKIEFESEEKFIEWAKTANPELLRIKTEINKKALNDLITDDNQVISTQGEIVPEVKVIQGETSVSFVVAK